MTMGALPGVQGVELHHTDKLWAMPPGDKGTAVECTGQAPEPADLHEAELGLRLGSSR
jgi:hypothetical protein